MNQDSRPSSNALDDADRNDRGRDPAHDPGKLARTPPDRRIDAGAAAEAIERATAPVGQDDGKR